MNFKIVDNTITYYSRSRNKSFMIGDMVQHLRAYRVLCGFVININQKSGTISIVWLDNRITDIIEYTPIQVYKNLKRL